MPASQLDGYLYLSFPHSPDEYCPQQPDFHHTPGSIHVVKKSHPVPTPTGWSRITAGIGMEVERVASSATFYNKLSTDFSDDVERVAKSLVALQDQLDSLAVVVLQNRRGLGLLTAEKGGLCLFLN